MEANLVVDFKNIRCGSCKALVRDKMVKVCPMCGLPFTRISSNHVGLASKLEAERACSGAGTAEPADVAIEPEDLYPEMVSG